MTRLELQRLAAEHGCTVAERGCVADATFEVILTPIVDHRCFGPQFHELVSTQEFLMENGGWTPGCETVRREAANDLALFPPQDCASGCSCREEDDG